MNTNFKPAKFQWWWDAIIDLMLANPQMTKAEIATRLRVTPTYVYMITCSDLFVAHYEARRAAMNAQVGDSITGKLLKVADTSLGLIADQMELKKTAIPLQLLSDVADKALSRLGYGPKSGPSTQINVQANGGPVQVSIPQVTAQDLDAARAALRRSQLHVIEGDKPLGKPSPVGRSEQESSARHVVESSLNRAPAAPTDSLPADTDPFAFAGAT